jgi:hypothetical protein
MSMVAWRVITCITACTTDGFSCSSMRKVAMLWAFSGD